MHGRRGRGGRDQDRYWHRRRQACTAAPPHLFGGAGLFHEPLDRGLVQLGEQQAQALAPVVGLGRARAGTMGPGHARTSVSRPACVPAAVPSLRHGPSRQRGTAAPRGRAGAAGLSCRPSAAPARARASCAQTLPEPRSAAAARPWPPPKSPAARLPPPSGRLRAHGCVSTRGQRAGPSGGGSGGCQRTLLGAGNVDVARLNALLDRRLDDILALVGRARRRLREPVSRGRNAGMRAPAQGAPSLSTRPAGRAPGRRCCQSESARAWPALRPTDAAWAGPSTVLARPTKRTGLPGSAWRRTGGRVDGHVVGRTVLGVRHGGGARQRSRRVGRRRPSSCTAVPRRRGRFGGGALAGCH